jgi:phage shock protein PspC (stress-responsive transcriptional regulator)
MAVFCHRCGAGLPASARFCSNCGNVITVTPPIPGRPLVRPLAGRQIAGVCIGLAQANGWDVSLVRILAVIGLFFSGGLVAVAYLACWIGIPEEPLNIPGYPPNV